MTNIKVGLQMVPSGTLLTSVSSSCDLKWRWYAGITILGRGDCTCGVGFVFSFVVGFLFCIFLRFLLSFEYQTGWLNLVFICACANMHWNETKQLKMAILPLFPYTQTLNKYVQFKFLCYRYVKITRLTFFERSLMLGKWGYKLSFVSLLRYGLSEVLQTS